MSSPFVCACMWQIKVTEEVAFSSQPTPGQLSGLAAFGFSSVVSLTRDDDNDCVPSEAGVLLRTGVEYVHEPPPIVIPVKDVAMTTVTLPVSDATFVHDVDAVSGGHGDVTGDESGAVSAAAPTTPSSATVSTVYPSADACPSPLVFVFHHCCRRYRCPACMFGGAVGCVRDQRAVDTEDGDLGSTEPRESQEDLDALFGWADRVLEEVRVRSGPREQLWVTQGSLVFTACVFDVYLLGAVVIVGYARGVWID